MLTAYKGVNRDMTGWGGFKFEEGVWYSEKEANCGRNGFHCAENPMDCLKHFPQWDSSYYYEVLVDGDIHEIGYDSRISCTRMQFLRRIETKEEFLRAVCRYLARNPYEEKTYHVTSNYGTETDAIEGMLLVRGKEPSAKCSLNTVVALLQEEADSPCIKKASIFTVDGKTYHPCVRYGLKRS